MKLNKPATLAGLCAVLVVAIALAATGCSVGSLVKHDVPKGMQKYNDGDRKVSLNDAPFLMADYMRGVESDVKRFVTSNEKAHMVADIFDSVLTVGIEELGNSPIPGATMISGLLLGFAGLMTRKPGTAKEIAAEKMASYSGGMDKLASKIPANPVTPELLRALIAEVKAEVK